MTKQQNERYYKKKHDRAIIKEKEVTSMKHLVVLQVGLFAESTVTNITPEWPGTVMHVHVALQVTRGRERLGTEVALVGLLLKCNKYVTIRCTRAEQSGAERSRAERRGGERSGAERRGGEGRGAERSGAEQSRAEQSRAEQSNGLL